MTMRVHDARNMRTFRIGPNPKNLREVRGLSYRQAAISAARKIYGSGVTVERVQIGAPDESFDDVAGYFQAYQVLPALMHEGVIYREKGQLKLGEPFWVQRLPKDAETTSTEAAYNMYAGLKDYVTLERLKNGNY